MKFAEVGSVVREATVDPIMEKMLWRTRMVADGETQPRFES